MKAHLISNGLIEKYYKFEEEEEDISLLMNIKFNSK